MQSCPKGHELKRHRVRDWRYQYFCKECDTYYTEDSKLPRVDVKTYYNEFIEAYINELNKGKRPSVIKLCKKLNISRTTLYRLYWNEQCEQEIKIMACLKKWCNTELLNYYKFSIDESEALITDYRKLLKLKIKVSHLDTGFYKLIIKSNYNLFQYWQGSSNGAKFSHKDNSIKCYCSSSEYPYVSAALIALREILWNYRKT